MCSPKLKNMDLNMRAMSIHRRELKGNKKIHVSSRMTHWLPIGAKIVEWNLEFGRRVKKQEMMMALT